MSILDLRPHGMHSPEYTRAVALHLAEAVRVLNYATGPDYAKDGIPYPNTTYDLIGGLKSAAGGLNQLYQQTALRLEHLNSDGLLVVRNGQFAGRPSEAVARFSNALLDASRAAAQMVAALERAHSAVSPIGMIEAR